MISEPSFFEDHINLFQQGQFCAEINGRIVASASSLIISLIPKYRDHAWYDIVGNRRIFTNHDPKCMGISLKIISGDNRHVASYVGQQIGLLSPNILARPDLHHMSNDALQRRAYETDIFAEIEPNQKERIILGRDGRWN